ncbi:MAG: hypothetical protein U9R08_03325 [Nanoarchaeota archaeon]|nr:hypothetical protein [Nanoarchaeota archaeon]
MDISEVIDQLKDFVRNESDTFLGLIVFLISELVILGYLFNEVFINYAQYHMLTFGSVATLTIIFWLFHRHIKFPKNRISIALANFHILSLDIHKHIGGEEKMILEDELLKYFMNALHNHKNRLNFEKYISIVNLPRRIKVNENNAKTLVKRLKANILIWGTAKYDSKDAVYIEPKFDFYREPKMSFYEKIKERLLSKEIYKIDLESELIRHASSDFGTLIHYIIYIAMLFDGIKNLNRRNYEEADRVFKSALNTLTSVKNPNTTLYDIHLAIRFCESRNLYEWGRYLVKHKRKRQALLKYDEASRLLLQRQKAQSSDEKLFLKNSYLFGIHNLILGGKLAPAKKRLKTLEKKMNNDPKVIKEEIEYLSKKDSKRAKSLIKKLSGKHLKHKEILFQSIADFYYKHGALKKAEAYYTKKLKLDPKQTYNPALFDVDDHIHLLKIHIKHSEFIKAQNDLLKTAIKEIKNKMVKTL